MKHTPARPGYVCRVLDESGEYLFFILLENIYDSSKNIKNRVCYRLSPDFCVRRDCPIESGIYAIPNNRKMANRITWFPSSLPEHSDLQGRYRSLLETTRGKQLAANDGWKKLEFGTIS